jgi:hypothetical protein
MNNILSKGNAFTLRHKNKLNIQYFSGGFFQNLKEKVKKMLYILKLYNDAQ